MTGCLFRLLSAFRPTARVTGEKTPKITGSQERASVTIQEIDAELKKIESKLADRERGTIWHPVVDSTLAVAILGSILFVWGYGHQSGFYQRLSYPESFPLDAPYKYMVLSMPFAQLALVSVVHVWRVTLTPSPYDTGSFGKALAQNIGFIILPFWILLLTIYRTLPVTLIIMGILTMYLPVHMTFNHKSLPYLLRKKSIGPYLLLVLVALSVSLCFRASVALGASRAMGLVTGQSDDGSVIELIIKNRSSALARNTYVLVEILDGNYYLIEMAYPAPDRPVLHVVPQSEVESARVQRHCVYTRRFNVRQPWHLAALVGGFLNPMFLISVIGPQSFGFLYL